VLITIEKLSCSMSMGRLALYSYCTGTGASPVVESKPSVMALLQPGFRGNPTEPAGQGQTESMQDRHDATLYCLSFKRIYSRAHRFMSSCGIQLCRRNARATPWARRSSGLNRPCCTNNTAAWMRLAVPSAFYAFLT
jgi:hypothetical protein